uniref:Lipase-like C-terminal domain-containing protein n=1 Tax=Salix viminalis TaxID=40686 RepID=A0A6N2LMQ7_SALVM
MNSRLFGAVFGEEEEEEEAASIESAVKANDKVVGFCSEINRAVCKHGSAFAIWPNVNVVVKVETSETTSSSTTKTTSVDDLPPIVLVHGIFGFGKGRLGGLSYFAGAEKKDERARELFYYLKGGQVDYGEEHSMAYGHSQFGRFYKQGHYPEWDEDHPIHFVGHSAGAQFCRLGTIIYDWFDIHWLKAYYNFGFDHFNMSWKKMGIFGLIDCLLGNTGPFASGDWILPDLTIQGSMQLNCHLQTFPDLFSYAPNAPKESSASLFLQASLESTHLFL